MKEYVHEIPSAGHTNYIEKNYDVIVVGGGLSGVCAAIASARNGAKTAIIQDRSVYGGNASSEIRMHVKGASCHSAKANAVETGILMELQLHNRYLNNNHNYSIWDGVLWSTIKETANLDSYLNTVMNQVNSDGTQIQWISCYQSTTELHYRMKGTVYIDATGNGSLGYFAGAEYRIGCEDKKAYGEESARDNYNGETMGNTIMFCAQDTGHPVRFVKPEWAYTFNEDDLEYRHHGDMMVGLADDKVIILGPGSSPKDCKGMLFEKYSPQSGYWWIELGGDWDHIITQAEDIRYELYKCVYGIWDHIKNQGDHGAENYELVWVGNQPGIRESRRFEGTYTLTEPDIRGNKTSDQDVAYGGWPMDEHTAGGLRAKGIVPSIVRNFEGLYGIPYGCYCSKTISNLMMAGRIIGVSKIAMGSTRVMGTCAIGGQAVGTAAALATRHHCTPRQVGETYIKELRQTLLKDDCYLIGCRNEDSDDLARTATITATSWKNEAIPQNVINGISRNEGNHINLWCSSGIRSQGETLSLKLDKVSEIHQVRITFDPNLNKEHCISISKGTMDRVPSGAPSELVKDYTVRTLLKGKSVWEYNCFDNYLRLNVINLPKTVSADEIQICITATNGDKDARIFEVRIY